jgi:Holliday junction resolvasome RuvABC ATP-dependent DNA helicase subunit
MDSDGHLNGPSTFDYVTKSEKLADGVTFLARSVGLRVTSSVKIIKYKGENRKYYRLTITGNCDKIPTKVERKKAKPRKQIKNPLVFGFSVEKAEVENYYGFTLDQDHLYLTEDFLIHHNCGKTRRVLESAAEMGCSEQDGTLIRLSPDAVENAETFVKLLDKHLSWDGYLCNQGQINHDNCNDCKIIDPVNPRGPIKKVAVFIDEIHGLSKDVQLAMLLILLDFRYQYQTKEGVVDKFFPKFTCFGATTDPGLLNKPLRTRFANKVSVPYYTDEQMLDIVHSMVKQRRWTVDPEAAEIIANISQGIAREAENHISGVYQCACYHNKMQDNDEFITHLTADMAKVYLKIKGFIKDGLSYDQLRLLHSLNNRVGNKMLAMGEKKILNTFGWDVRRYMDEVEPRLLIKNYLETTSRGRQLTEEGVRYIIEARRKYPKLFEELI